MSDPTTRVSDTEREAAVHRLGEHAAAGRLEPVELENRVGAALAARTCAELAAVEWDLPGPASQKPAPKPVAPRAARRSPRQLLPGGELASYLAVMGLLVTIWALTGAGYFWPVWPALGWGVALIGSGGRCAGRDHRGLSRRAAPRA